MTRVFLIRHGATDWRSVQPTRIQGQAPGVSLNEEGKAQARKLAQRLSREPISAIYASPLERAYDTAKIVAEPHGLPVRTDPRLMEQNHGEWEGKTDLEVERESPGMMRRIRMGDITAGAPGGERGDTLRRRALDAFREIVATHPNQTVAIVSHGGPIRMILNEVEPSIANREFDHGFASISLIECSSERCELKVYSDSSHLDG
ncbi:MAG: histidine phosphatase family protein [bacterium]